MRASHEFENHGNIYGFRFDTYRIASILRIKSHGKVRVFEYDHVCHFIHFNISKHIQISWKALKVCKVIFLKKSKSNNGRQLHKPKIIQQLMLQLQSVVKYEFFLLFVR